MQSGLLILKEHSISVVLFFFSHIIFVLASIRCFWTVIQQSDILILSSCFSHLFSRGRMRFEALPPWRGWCTYMTTWGDAVWSSPWQIWMLCPPYTLPIGWDGRQSENNTHNASTDICLYTGSLSSEYPRKWDSWNSPRCRSHTSVRTTNSFQCPPSEYFPPGTEGWGAGLPLCTTGTTTFKKKKTCQSMFAWNRSIIQWLTDFRLIQLRDIWSRLICFRFDIQESIYFQCLKSLEDAMWFSVAKILKRGNYI